MNYTCIPFYVKRKTKRVCPVCKESFLRGSPCIKTYHKKGLFLHYSLWHIDCWIARKNEQLEASHELFVDKIAVLREWFGSNAFEPKKGRNRKAKYGAKKQWLRLKARQRYYRRIGRKDKVEELEIEIKELELEVK